MSVMSRCDSSEPAVTTIWNQGLFYWLGELGCVSLCMLCMCVAMRSYAMWRWTDSRRNKERNTDKFSKTLQRKQALPASEVFIHITGMTSALPLVQITATELHSKRRHPVIWQKWHLLSGHYTTMGQIMVLHTEINLNGVLNWHFSNSILTSQALDKHVFMFKSTNHFN